MTKMVWVVRRARYDRLAVFTRHADAVKYLASRVGEIIECPLLNEPAVKCREYTRVGTTALTKWAGLRWAGGPRAWTGRTSQMSDTALTLPCGSGRVAADRRGRDRRAWGTYVSVSGSDKAAVDKRFEELWAGVRAD